MFTEYYKDNLLGRLARRTSPSQVLVLSFGMLILLGAGILTLPWVTYGDKEIGFIDALFTSTSAVCVTGLVVVDTGSTFNLAGQLTIMTLIQLGGLGIMTFSVFFLRLVGKGTSLRDEMAVRAGLSISPRHHLPSLIRSVIVYTLFLELAGAALLFLSFSADYPPFKAAYLALFHSISAFCNAGFALWPDNLTPFKTDLGANLVFMILIIAGGLGFVVLHELATFRKGLRRRLSLHSKIVFTTSASLIVFGALVFLVLEYNNVMRDLSFGSKILVSFFQSVTTRTAGFNTVEIGHMTNTSLLVIIFLMFVGGSPGGTAGGVKTVSFTLLAAVGLSRFRGFSRVNIFRRSLDGATVDRAHTIVLMALAVLIVALGLLLISETWQMDHMKTRDSFLELLFECISAFGTVGLSMGKTPYLTPMGRLIIIGTMFVGRLGPLTVALALLKSSAAVKGYNYGQEEVIVA